MVMRSAPQSNSKSATFKGAVFLLGLTLLSVLSLNVLGRTVNFIFLPVMAIFLWPRVENPIGSIVIILMFGLLLDIISAGPLGLWPLIFLVIFTLFRPNTRSKPRLFWSSFIQWLGALALSVIGAYLLGWFALERLPDIGSLLTSAAAAIAAFPLVYSLRHVARQILSDSDVRGI